MPWTRAEMDATLVVDVLSGLLILVGTGFFLAGTVGLLRFPDVYTRLHALTKADVLGLGFVVFGLSVHADGWGIRVQLVVIWLLVLAATATVAHLLARISLEEGVPAMAGDPGAPGRPGGPGEPQESRP